MRHDVLAPWAEPVPNAPYPMTVDELELLPDDLWLYELVEGRLVRMAGSGSEAALIATYIVYLLMNYVRPRKLGSVSGTDGQYNLTLPGEALETALIPDVAFVQAGRLAARGSAEIKRIPLLAPDLVVEIASPNQYHLEMDAKAHMYLERGVRLVWIVWPGQRQIDVWRANASAIDQPTTTLHASDALDGLDVLPGFTHPVKDIFESY